MLWTYTYDFAYFWIICNREKSLYMTVISQLLLNLLFERMKQTIILVLWDTS
jgi:hypothetical protein